MRGSIKLFVVLVLGALLAVPTGAMAQSSSEGGYNPPGSTVQDQIESQPSRENDRVTPDPPAATADEGGGNLPFTGLDLALIVAAGGVLLMLGLGIRRATRASTEVA